ncbi:MAG: RNA polymerase sigma factor [Vicinamibacterales bacterium]
MSIAAPVPSTVEGFAPSPERLSGARGVALTSELEDLFREQHQLIYRTAYSVTGSRSDSEDVLQIIFLRLLRRGMPPDLVKNPKGYLYRAAINVSLNTVRDRERRKVDGDPERVLTVIDPGAPSGLDSEIRRQLLDAIATLSPRAVEILILRHVHDQSDAEIARMLGTSRGTVAVALFRARARLKKLLSHVKPEGTR